MTIRVLPAGKGARTFDPDRIVIEWRAAGEDPPSRKPGARAGHRDGKASTRRVPGVAGPYQRPQVAS